MDQPWIIQTNTLCYNSHTPSILASIHPSLSEMPQCLSCKSVHQVHRGFPWRAPWMCSHVFKVRAYYEEGEERNRGESEEEMDLREAEGRRLAATLMFSQRRKRGATPGGEEKKEVQNIGAGENWCDRKPWVRVFGFKWRRIQRVCAATDEGERGGECTKEKKLLRKEEDRAFCGSMWKKKKTG